MIQNIPQAAKAAGDGSAVAVAFAALVGYLPAIASLASILWIGIQAYYFIKEKRNKKGSK